ncbi:uncharacterized protein LOC122387074 [Amphibalanus amphitrite]|uniref:uncharacterized protein LOC122387074 n=1 Tax=Amphibalanus amphitrite TaxID=1232801 RepID=UPI001C915A82|nr:uncharacterized protein LOC122387074 [Amphibalanus amphitrite]
MVWPGAGRAPAAAGARRRRRSAGGVCGSRMARGRRAGAAARPAARLATLGTDWVAPSTCVLLEREEGAAGGLRPGLTVAVADGRPLAIAGVTVLSEFGRCELFGDHGEYLATEDARLEEAVDDTEVRCLRHRCRPPVRQLTLQCVSAAGRRQLWLYGLEVELEPAAARTAFSLPAVLARLHAQQAPLSEGAELALRAALAGSGPAPPGRTALAAGCRTPAGEPAEGGSRGGAEPAGAEGGHGPGPAVVERCLDRSCVAAIEQRLWQRIGPRLERIERQQDAILAALHRLGRAVSAREAAPDIGSEDRAGSDRLGRQ